MKKTCVEFLFEVHAGGDYNKLHKEQQRDVKHAVEARLAGIISGRKRCSATLS